LGCEGVPSRFQRRGEACHKNVIFEDGEAIDDLAIPNAYQVGLIAIDKASCPAAQCPARTKGLGDAGCAAQDLCERQLDQIGPRNRVVSSTIWAFGSARPCASVRMSRVRSLTLFCTVAIILPFCDS
jgi:hypothetical protein